MVVLVVMMVTMMMVSASVVVRQYWYCTVGYRTIEYARVRERCSPDADRWVRG
jgi:hypothetical protein